MLNEDSTAEKDLLLRQQSKNLIDFISYTLYVSVVIQASAMYRDTSKKINPMCSARPKLTSFILAKNCLGPGCKILMIIEPQTDMLSLLVWNH